MSATPQTTSSLTEDIPCARCTYNLRGLSPTGLCPECGFTITSSIATFRYMPVLQRRALARSIRLLGGSMYMPFLLVALGIVGSVFSFGERLGYTLGFLVVAAELTIRVIAAFRIRQHGSAPLRPNRSSTVLVGLAIAEAALALLMSVVVILDITLDFVPIVWLFCTYLVLRGALYCVSGITVDGMVGSLAFSTHAGRHYGIFAFLCFTLLAVFILFSVLSGGFGPNPLLPALGILSALGCLLAQFGLPLVLFWAADIVRHSVDDKESP